MYWCARSWILTRTQCAHLRAVLDRMLRKMIYVPRPPDGSAETHMTRWARLLRNCRKNTNPHMATKLISPASSRTDHDERSEERWETSTLFLHKNVARLRNLKKELGTQCHGRRFRVWRCKQAVVQCLGDEWVNVAQNNAVWRSKLEEMIIMKKQTIKGRTC